MIKELSVEEFENFVKSSPLASHFQSSNYGILMSEIGYDYDLIGYFDEQENLVAASLILFKKLGIKAKYGYAPKGFILDYLNQSLLQSFTKALKEYYRKKNVTFIKINPEIAIAELDPKSFVKTYNWNTVVIDNLKNCNYLKLKDNLYFESKLPHFNAIVNLKTTKMKDLDKNTRNKIKRSFQKGLEIEIADRSGIDILNEFIIKKNEGNEYYYKDYYNVFIKNNMIDLFLVSINTQEYLLNAKASYEKELEINNELNQSLINNNSQKNINLKMNSDRKLLSYKNDVLEATERNSKDEKIYIAGALVVKYNNRVQIIESGFDKKYKRFNPNYYLHYKIMEYYKQADGKYTKLQQKKCRHRTWTRKNGNVITK